MTQGFLYLIAIMDWHSRRVLAWRLSNTLDAGLCVEALKKALARFGAPEIFNTDQGCQFTSVAFTDVLNNAGVRISMDGRGRWLNNVFAERPRPSAKDKVVHLRAYEIVSKGKASRRRYFTFYNQRRPRAALDEQTPDAVYCKILPPNLAA